jgi:hypothetical protein
MIGRLDRSNRIVTNENAFNHILEKDTCNMFVSAFLAETESCELIFRFCMSCRDFCVYNRSPYDKSTVSMPIPLPVKVATIGRKRKNLAIRLDGIDKSST